MENDQDLAVELQEKSIYLYGDAVITSLISGGIANLWLFKGLEITIPNNGWPAKHFAGAMVAKLFLNPTTFGHVRKFLRPINPSKRSATLALMRPLLHHFLHNDTNTVSWLLDNLVELQPH